MSDTSTATAWRCRVCGYIHRGEEPPNMCVVCGSPKEMFEPYQDPEKPQAPQKPSQLRCMVCNYMHAGDAAPGSCPVCSAGHEKFEPVFEAAEAAAIQEKELSVVVVGGGIAGVSAVEAVRQGSSRARITLVSKEKHLPYYRLNLTRLLAGEVEESALPVHPESWYRENRVELLTGREVNGFSLTEKKLSLMDGTKISFDKLILTAGAHPFVPPVPGIKREGVTPLRTLEDARFIKVGAEKAQSVVIIGGGILGLETAGALAKFSKSVTVLESFSHLMPRQLTRKAAALLEKHVENLGVRLKTGISVKEIAGDERVGGVVLESGETIPADLVIFAAGVRPNSYLARVAGLHVDNGIIVNDTMETSQPDIYAAGDIAEHRGTLYGLWNAAQYQGSIAGMNAAGREAEFGGIPRTNTIKVLGVDLFSIGTIEAEDGSYLVVEEENDGNYTRFVFHDTHLVGAILYGKTAISTEVKNAIEKRKDFSALTRPGLTAAEVWNAF